VNNILLLIGFVSLAAVHPILLDPANILPQGTSDVRLDPQLNKKVWECGIKGVPYRLRVRISRKRNDEEDAKEKLYSYVQAVNVANPKGLQTAVVEDN
jgi:large subunit ribosomal protein L31e